MAASEPMAGKCERKSTADTTSREAAGFELLCRRIFGMVYIPWLGFGHAQ